MSRDEERAARAAEAPVVGGLPPAPGILAAMMLTPDLGLTLNKLANHLLVDPFPGATLSRAERELLATAVSASNDCFFCMDSHAAFACELLARQGDGEGAERRLDEIKEGKSGDFGPKMAALMAIARQVAAAPRRLTRAQIEAALSEGATDGDTLLAVLIASAFSMYNRAVDGLRAATPPVATLFRERAPVIAEHGYGLPPGPRP